MIGSHVTIFEGPDGAGKTTLMEHWAGRGELLEERVHLGPHEIDPFSELLNYLHNYRRYPVSFDRFHLGEEVYGPIYRGKDGLAGRKGVVESILRARRAVVVIALPPYSVCHANWARRKAAGGEMFPDPAKHRRVYDAYMTIGTALPVVAYDYTLQDMDRACLAIVEARRAAYYNQARAA